jgi:hypothetical protein
MEKEIITAIALDIGPSAIACIMLLTKVLTIDNDMPEVFQKHP